MEAAVLLFTDKIKLTGERASRIGHLTFLAPTREKLKSANSVQAKCSLYPSSQDLELQHRSISTIALNLTSLTVDGSLDKFDKVASFTSLLKERKSPGPHNISDKILKIFSKNKIAYLFCIINAVMRLQYFPSSWKLTIVICIPKAGKPPRLAPSCRQISTRSLRKSASGVWTINTRV